MSALPGGTSSSGQAGGAGGMGGLLVPEPLLRPASAEAESGAGTASDWSGPDWSGEDPLPKVLAATNPLLEAARSLLRSLTELPSLSFQAENVSEQHESLERLHQTLVRDMRRFLSLCGRAGLRREHVVTAGYCLCTAIDEAVSKARVGNADSSPIGHESIHADMRSTSWSSRSLLLLFHNETNGGEKFFLLLGHMVQTPREHLHVLELLYRILSLGFEGRYALSLDGTRRLESIQRKLLTVLIEHSDPVPRELSPHWKGLSGGRLRFMRTIPVWVTASVLTLALTALFMSSSAELEPLSATTTRQIRQLAAQPDIPQGPRWKDELPLELWFTDAEMRRYGLSVDIPEQTLRLPGSLTFTNGVQLNPQVRPILNVIAERLKETAHAIKILGHTDNTRLRTGSIFKDNQHLSDERAKIVAQELTQRGIAPERMTALGRSDTQPLGNNNTANGRMLNRRVELVLVTEAEAKADPNAAAKTKPPVSATQAPRKQP